MLQAPYNNIMVQDFDTKIKKLEIKAKDLDDRILAIENKYQYIARSETKSLYKSKANINNKILELRKAKQTACDHSKYEVETLDIPGVYKEEFCSNCNYRINKDAEYNNKMNHFTLELQNVN